MSGTKAKRISLCAAAASAVLLAAAAARADVLVQSFETGGFDFPGNASVSYGTLSTDHATEGTYSLHVTAPQSWWIDFGYLQISAAAVSAHSILQFDVFTSTGVNFVPIFHNDPNLPTEPWSGGWNGGPGIYISAGAGVQTFTFDYANYDFDGNTPGIQPLQVANTVYSLQLQGSTGNAVDFYIDNVRLIGNLPVLDSAVASWQHNGSGAWVEATNWDSDPAGSIPGAAGSFVTFGTHGGSITTTEQIVVNVTQAVTVARMDFDKGDGGYKITGNFPVNVSARINVNSGNHVISAPVSAAGGSIFSVAADSTLTIDNLGGGGYGLFEKEGAGTLIVDKMRNVSLNLLEGTLEFKPGNVQNNGWIYGLSVLNGSTFKMNGATMRTNVIANNETPGTIDLGTGGVIHTGLYANVAYYGTITGAGSVIIGAILPEDAGASATTVTFGGSNSYSGTTSVVHGNVLQVSSANNLGDGSPTNYLVLDQGTLRATGSFSSDRKVSIGVGGGTIDTNGNDVGVGVIDPGPFTKTGDGVLTVTRLENLPSATIQAGTLRVAPNGTATGTSKVESLTIAAGASLDLTDNDLVLDYAGSGPNAALTSQVRQQLAAGTITTSATTPVGTKLGYLDNAALGTPLANFGGVAVDASSVLIKFTYAGDANLDGQVDITDLAALATAWQTAGVWVNGDFNYDAFVDITDLAALATNWQLGVGAPLAMSFEQALASVGLGGVAVPEPVSTGLLGVAAIGLLARKRRS